jgi:short-subunit dehydrogenase
MFFTLITGASMGIGEAFAREFGARGHNLVLVARSAEKLHALAEELRKERGVRIEVCVEDLSHVDAPASVYEFCSQLDIKVDFLVNCAGLSRAGYFDDILQGKLEEIMMVNMMAMAKLTRLFVSDMVARRQGNIINVASLGGLQGVPGLGLYSASKAFVITLTEVLYIELQNKGIHVVVVCPGFIDTGFFEHSGHNAAKIRLPLSRTDVVVKAAITGLVKKKIRVFPTLLDVILVVSQRLVSRKIVVRLAGFFAGVNDD